MPPRRPSRRRAAAVAALLALAATVALALAGGSEAGALPGLPSPAASVPTAPVVLGPSLPATPLPASAAPIASPGRAYLPYTPPAVSTGTVTLEREAVTIPTDGAYDLRVRASLPTVTAYHEVRLRVFRPSGALLIQKTEIRHDVPAGSAVTTFTRDLTDLGLRQGRYALQIRVRSEAERGGGVSETVIDDRLLLYEREAAPVKVAVIVRIQAAPSIDPEGRFAVDPEETSEGRDAAATISALLRDTQGLRLTLGIAPVMLDEWDRASDGFALSSPAGVRQVSASAPAALAYASAIRSLRDALATRRAELLDVPYADPDLSGLAAIGALGDLPSQYERGSSTYLRALEATPGTGSGLFRDRLPKGALGWMRKAGVRYFPLDASLVQTEAADGIESGAYHVQGGGLTALLVDPVASEALAAGDTSAAAFLDRAFERLDSDDATLPLIATVTLGPGERADADAVARSLRALAAAPWARLVTARDASRLRRPEALALPERLDVTSGTPSGYWSEVRTGRRYAAALASALGTAEPDGDDAVWSAAVASSGSWAGPDLQWSLADRGRAFAAAAAREARGVLDLVGVESKDVTLSGRKGEVPVSITNGSDRVLHAVLRARASSLLLPEGDARRVDLQPQENFVTLPVDLGAALAGRLTVELWSEELLLGSTTVTVRASYLDRLAILLGIALVLAAILVFIRKRVRSAEHAHHLRR